MRLTMIRGISMALILAGCSTPAFADADVAARGLAIQALNAVNAIAASLPPIQTAPPAISGTPTVGSVLTSSKGTWLGVPSFTYQWQRGGVPINGATGLSYTLVSADSGATITAVITATNARGATSATTQAVTIGGVAPPSYTPSLDHSDARNSQYL